MVLNLERGLVKFPGLDLISASRTTAAPTRSRGRKENIHGWMDAMNWHAACAGGTTRSLTGECDGWP